METNKFDSVPIMVSLLIILGTFILSVAVHELGHGISFLRSGMGFRALLITIFGFIKENGGIKFKFISMKNLGGIAVPELKSINSEEEFIFYKNAFSKALIMGPLSSIILGLLCGYIDIPIDRKRQ